MGRGKNVAINKHRQDSHLRFSIDPDALVRLNLKSKINFITSTPTSPNRLKYTLLY